MATKSKNLCRFTRELDEQLIDLVSRNSMLFDAGHAHYKDLNERDSAWQTIAEEIGKSVMECKTRWRSLRDLYHRKKKEQKMGKKVRSTWEYMDAMHFLDNFTSRRRILENYIPDEAEEMSIDIKQEFDPDQPGPSAYYVEEEVPSKRAREEEEQFYHYEQAGIAELLRELVDLGKQKEDPTMTFFDSMARTVIKFPPAKIAEVKLKICQIVTETECEILGSQTGNL